MSKITILGTGSWGCALAHVLLSNGHDVMFWGRNKDQVKMISQGGSVHLDDFKFSSTPKATENIQEAAEFSDDILIALPSHAVLEVLNALSSYITRPKRFICASKGLEPTSLMRISEVVYETIPVDYIESYVLLSGPSHAEEVIRQDITAVTSVSYSEQAAVDVQTLFSNDFFRVYTHTDLKGAELCGAMKNAMAIGAGILDGIGYGDNAKSAFIIRSINEMTRLGTRMGIEASTLYGLAGMGDAIVTCISKFSRNRNCGEMIGKGLPVEEAIKAQGMTVEGIPAIRSFYRLTREYGVKMPIIEELYQVVYGGKDVSHSLNDLMTRDLKPE